MAKYEWLEGQKEFFIEEMMSYYKMNGYITTRQGVIAQLDEFADKKGDLLNLLAKHPQWDRWRMQIVCTQDYERMPNDNKIRKFFHYFNGEMNLPSSLLQELAIDGKNYKDATREKNKWRTLYDIFDQYEAVLDRDTTVINGLTSEQVETNRDDAIARLQRFLDEGQLVGRNVYSAESYNKYRAYDNIVDRLIRYNDSVVDEDLEDIMNRYLPELKAKKGMKTSRIVQKFMKYFDIDKFEHLETVKEPVRDENGEVVKVNGETVLRDVTKMVKPFNREYAQYADAINPLLVTRFSVISCNPIAFLAQSKGHKWHSCHDIRYYGDDGAGCYSSGTVSYMLDATSFVFYTVDNRYNGIEYDKQEKITRCMFSYSKGKLCQGRLYPDDQSDHGHSCSGNKYTPIRNWVQEIITTALGVPNAWTMTKVNKIRNDVEYGRGRTCYGDYTRYDNCNISYLKDNEEAQNEVIIVGAQPICPKCGLRHTRESLVICHSCFGGDEKIVCDGCGKVHERDDMHFIDGKFYCGDCVFWCSMHSRYEQIGEVGKRVDVEGYGSMCDAGLQELMKTGKVHKCGHCGKYTINNYYDYNGKSVCNYCRYDKYVRILRRGDKDYCYPRQLIVRCYEEGESILKKDAMYLDNSWYCSAHGKARILYRTRHKYFTPQEAQAIELTQQEKALYVVSRLKAIKEFKDTLEGMRDELATSTQYFGAMDESQIVYETFTEEEIRLAEEIVGTL